LKYRTLPIREIEKAEDIELLRLIENGIKVRVGVVNSNTIAVDTLKDLERVRELITPPPVLFFYGTGAVSG
jgi:3-deoxy-manno-octulosonate cytidylyltransferase (CMP-KDO synthetase)